MKRAVQNVKSHDLIEVAKELAANINGGKPKQAFLRRSVSTTYYALFHALARCCADCLIGVGRNSPAWEQVYRSLQHKLAKDRCKNQAKISLFPKEIQDFANFFVTMQSKRHNADYNPTERFTASAVRLDIEQAEFVIADFLSAPTADRRAFAAFVILQLREN